MIRILIPLDGSSVAERALPHAVSIARTFSAEIELLGVVDNPGDNPPAPVSSLDWQLSRIETEVYLSRIVKSLEAKAVKASWCLREGKAAQAIIQRVREAQTDLLIMTRYGGGDAQLFSMGGTAQKVVSSAAASVLLIDPAREFDDARGFASVLVAVDGSQCSEWALVFAAMVAQACNGCVHVLRIVAEPSLPAGTPVSAETRQFLDHIRRIAKSQASLQLRSMIATIPPNVDKSCSVISSNDIPATIEQTVRQVGADLVVVAAEDAGADRRGGYGLVCDALLSRARFPVLVLRSQTAKLSSNHFRSVYLDLSELRADAV